MVCIDETPQYQPGDPPPTGYVAWHAWADVQHHAGLRQSRCPCCALWRFPQEMSERAITYPRGRTVRQILDGESEVMETAIICKCCAANLK